MSSSTNTATIRRTGLMDTSCDYQKPERRIDKDGFTIPYPVSKTVETVERTAKRQTTLDPRNQMSSAPATLPKSDKTAAPLSIRTGKPLSPETIEYAKKMRELMDAAVKKKTEQEIYDLNSKWKIASRNTLSKTDSSNN